MPNRRTAQLSARHTTLVSAATLADHDADAGWVVFDCRHDLARPEAGRRDYQSAHIPGAFFLHTDTDLSGPKNGHNGRHPLPERETLAATLRAAGVSATTQVVAYDASGGMLAARLWWLLRWLGHENVAVLDGGLPVWLAAGLPMDSSVPAARTGTLPVLPSLVPHVDAGNVLNHLGNSARLLVDARAAERYRGDVEPIDPVGGHIPGASNRFFQLNLQADGRFKPGTALREEFAALLGAHAPDAVVHQCGSGVSACHNLLAMDVAGLHGGALYPGSWSEWCADPSRPMRKG